MRSDKIPRPRTGGAECEEGIPSEPGKESKPRVIHLCRLGGKKEEDDPSYKKESRGIGGKGKRTSGNGQKKNRRETNQAFT